ncbi:MAG: GNAT family N-acetyltransferase [Saprospiraceae bacterium]
MIDRNEKNLTQLYQELATVGNCTLQMSPNFNWVDCRPSSWPTMIFASDVLSADFPTIVEGIRQSIIPAFWIRLRQNDLLAVNQHFGNYGFRQLAEWRGMCLRLADLASTAPKSTATLEEVTTRDDLKRWVALANETLFKSRPIEENMFQTVYQHSKATRFYLAKVADQAASILLSFVKDNTVGIYAVSTLETFRNRGISSALTHYALTAAKNEDCDLATLQATKMGEGVYRKLGFKIYGNFDVYWLLGYQ